MVSHFVFLIKLEEEKREGDNKDGESLLAKTSQGPELGCERQSARPFKGWFLILKVSDGLSQELGDHSGMNSFCNSTGE